MAENLVNPEALSQWSGPADTGPAEPLSPGGQGNSIIPILRVLLAVVVLPAAVFGVVWWTSAGSGTGTVERADVGDCMPASVLTETWFNAKDQPTVDCDAAEAAFSVIGLVKAGTFEGTDADVCASPYPSTDEVLWLGEPGKPGVVFCLQRVSH